MKQVANGYEGKKVVLAVTARDYLKTKPAEGGPIIRELEALGCRAIRVVDGDARGLECDLLILHGNCRAIHRYPKLLTRQGRRGPKVALWQLDPLPPRDIDRDLEARALRLAGKFASHRLARPIDLLIGMPLYRTISKRGLGPFSDPGLGHHVDHSMARTSVEAYAAIVRGLADGWLDRVYVSTGYKQKFLADRGIDAGFVPFGYYPGLGEDYQRTRDIDVLFIGSLKQRDRQKRLDKVIGEIGRAGVRVEIVTGGVYRGRRVDLLNRTKIVLHIHKYPWDTPWMRWAMAAANGALVVSEPLIDPDPFRAGVHYFEAPAEELPATIIDLLANPGEISAAATRCREFVRQHVTLRGSLEEMLCGGLGRPIPCK